MLCFASLLLACGLFSPGAATSTPPANAPQADLPEGRTGATPELTLSGLYEEYAGTTYAQGGISAYLQAGGETGRLQERLTAIDTGSGEQVMADVVIGDLTGDGCEDVLVSLALPSVPGYGDAILAAYICQEDGYVRHNLFGRVGAGSRGEGLYEGGGARIEGVMDLNADGLPEVLFYVASLHELYIAGWDGRGFTSLVDHVDELGNPQGYIPAREGAFEIQDLDDDGVFEVVLSDPPAVWRWDGNLFSPGNE